VTRPARDVKSARYGVSSEVLTIHAGHPGSTPISAGQGLDRRIWATNPGGPDPGPHRRGDLSSAAHPTRRHTRRHADEPASAGRRRRRSPGSEPGNQT